jgi:hypothetical protein
MAMVHLSNLFEKDKNFYGLLEPIEDKSFVVYPGIHFEFLMGDFKDEFLSSFKEAIKMNDLFNTAINTPEWRLNSEGKFVWFTPGLYKVKGKLIFLDLIEINASGMLKLFIPKEDLLRIAELVSSEWKREEEDNKLSRKFKYFEPMLDSESRVVNVFKFNTFKKKVIEKEI